MSQFVIEKVKDLTTIDQAKLMADKHRSELGFHSRQTFIDSTNKNELLVAKISGQVKGFVRFHHRRDRLTTLYEIATAPEARNLGIGRKLVDALVADCQTV